MSTSSLVIIFFSAFLSEHDYGKAYILTHINSQMNVHNVYNIIMLFELRCKAYVQLGNLIDFFFKV